MTIEELYEIVKEQQNKIEDLEKELLYLRKWSDDNDYWLREMIDALTDSVNKLMGIEDDERDYDYVYERALADVLEAIEEENMEE